MAGKPINIRIRSRHGDDPKALLAAINATLGNRRTRELNVEIDTRDEDPPPVGFEGKVPDEPRETEVAAKANNRLERKRTELRDRGEDPDARRPGTAGERIEKRERVHGFGIWLCRAFGGATVTVLVKALWDWAKDKIA